MENYRINGRKDTVPAGEEITKLRGIGFATLAPFLFMA